DAEDPESPYTLLTVCENGYGKRTAISEYRRQGRSGKGIIDIKTSERNGPVMGTALVHERDDVMIITTAGKIIRFNVSSISRIGRNTMGVRLVSLDEGEAVAAAARLAEEDQDGVEGQEGLEEKNGFDASSSSVNGSGLNGADIDDLGGEADDSDEGGTDDDDSGMNGGSDA